MTDKSPQEVVYQMPPRITIDKGEEVGDCLREANEAIRTVFNDLHAQYHRIVAAIVMQFAERTVYPQQIKLHDKCLHSVRPGTTIDVSRDEENRCWLIRVGDQHE